MTKKSPFQSLPAWIYADADFFELEKHKIFMPGWQLICHEADIPVSGDFYTFDFFNERVFAIRGEDGKIRAFHNVCRHRASRLLKGQAGSCKRITCPYHAWTYALNGALKSVPFERDFVDFKKAQYGLTPVDMEIWQGFIFVRFKKGGPAVADIMGAFAGDFAKYRLQDLKPLGRVTLRPRDANWKTVADNYVDALHIDVAHGGLFGLFGTTYDMEVKGGLHKLWGDIVPTNKETLSVRLYKKFLPEDCRRRWEYFRFWPNLAFDCYPDQVDFMQMIPIGPKKTMIREISYALPDGRREMKAARYLNWRINRQVNAEDHALISGVEEGMASSSFTQGPFARREACLIASAEKIREILPVAKNSEKPSNTEMTGLLEEARQA